VWGAKLLREAAWSMMLGEASGGSVCGRVRGLADALRKGKRRSQRKHRQQSWRKRSQWY